MCQRDTALSFWRRRKPKETVKPGSGVTLRVNGKGAAPGLTEAQQREIRLWLEPESVIRMEPPEDD